ncbi:unnamed protein product, partial [Adineta steineri]
NTNVITSATAGTGTIASSTTTINTNTNGITSTTVGTGTATSSTTTTSTNTNGVTSATAGTGTVTSSTTTTNTNTNGITSTTVGTGTGTSSTTTISTNTNSVTSATAGTGTGTSSTSTTSTNTNSITSATVGTGTGTSSTSTTSTNTNGITSATAGTGTGTSSTTTISTNTNSVTSATAGTGTGTSSTTTTNTNTNSVTSATAGTGTGTSSTSTTSTNTNGITSATAGTGTGTSSTTTTNTNTNSVTSATAGTGTGTSSTTTTNTNTNSITSTTTGTGTGTSSTSTTNTNTNGVTSVTAGTGTVTSSTITNGISGATAITTEVTTGTTSTAGTGTVTITSTPTIATGIVSSTTIGTIITGTLTTEAGISSTAGSNNTATTIGTTETVTSNSSVTESSTISVTIGTVASGGTTLTTTIVTSNSITTIGNISVSTLTSSTTSATQMTTTMMSTLTTTSTTSTTTITAITRICEWTSWLPFGNCTPSCGTAYRQTIRSCIDVISGQSCSSNDCGGGSAIQNESCSTSPPCETLTLTPPTTLRDPNLRISSYQLPDSMYFFENTYSRIWIADKGYITLDTPYYGQTMTDSVFRQLFNQAIVAPFWADLLYDTTSSKITLNWFSSTNATQSEIDTYNVIIQRTVNEACPVQSCTLNFPAVRVVRINWQNLFYNLTNNNQSISISFSAYLINTYEVASSRYPILRSYLSFDYTNLTNSLGSLRPFVGYRGKYSFLQVLNNPFDYQNALFLRQSSHKSFYIGGRFLTDCEVSFLEETTFYNTNPLENLNDNINNPSFPCPCTLGQARSDRRFIPLYSETIYEWSQNTVCYGPVITSWIRWGGTNKLLRSQTCCYNLYNGGLITYGGLAGSVLSNPLVIFQLYPWQRRIPFHDQCCSPSYPNAPATSSPCYLYYQLHPPSTCTGYHAPSIVAGVGDPHIDTIDNGRYTCHIQGLFIFSQTTTNANVTAQYNFNNAAITDSNLLYPDDLFYIYVRSTSTTPALYYVERMQGYGSVFTSYIVGAGNYTFTITNINGQFGFTVNTSSSYLSLTADLANNLNYDSINLTDLTNRYMYRVKQIGVVVLNKTIPQLTLAIWSGLSLECQIMSDNLECLLTLPEKYRTHIEGLAGNFNGLYGDDLINRATNQTVTILPADSQTISVNDANIYSACLSWKVPSDTTADITRPIMPSAFVNWYYVNASNTLANLNPRLSQTIVNGTCSSNFECIHDYLIEINPISSSATALLLNSNSYSRTILAETPPTMNVSSPVDISLPYTTISRTYLLPISISGVNSVSVTISQNGTLQNSTFNGVSIGIPIPNDTSSYVELFLTMTYGTNSTLIQYLDIIACLCTDSSYCNYQQTTTISNHYLLASCTCPDQYDGVFCQYPYNGCNSSSACRIYWSNETTCEPLSSADQVLQNRSYTCNGTCLNGYSSSNNYTCEDVNECTNNSTLCGNGVCINVIGSYTCNCSSGYRFDNQTCININECEEPNIDGTYPFRCDVSQVCIDTIGNFTCECSPVFNTTGTCIFNSSLCVNNNTCTSPIDPNVISCLYGTVNRNNTCIPWCNSTCPGFCERTNGYYQCNCMKWPGFQYTSDGKSCSGCGDRNYGYGCNESCQCNFGTCNPNATNVNQSCTCNTGYTEIFCDKRIDICALNNTYDSTIEDCITDPNDGDAVYICRPGYAIDSTTGNCSDVNECANNQSYCNVEVSSCMNTVGSYLCNCLSGYQSINGSCIDINECAVNASACSVYNNTYCVNIKGSYECRCNFNYAIGGDYTQLYGNVLNTNELCLPINYTSFCANQCMPPATCSATTGRCECPSSNYTLVNYALNDTLQTCQCPGHPFIYFNGTSCINATGITWFLLNYTYTTITSRVAQISPTSSSNIENDISDILYDMNVTCNGSCLNTYDTQDAVPPNLELMITLNVLLNVSQRLALTNQIINRSIVYNESYSLSMIRMIMNPATNTLVNISAIQPVCQECVYASTGVCSATNNSCTCFSGYEGNLCRTVSLTTSLSSTSSSDTNWTVIVAVISAIAGLFIIISIAMCIYFILRKCRKSPSETKSSVQRPQFIIPRAHIPTIATSGARAMNPWDGFSLDNTYDEQYVDASDSFPSSSTTTYNTTYRTNGKRIEADFGIFDELENRIPIPRNNNIPRVQMSNMMGTLNSLPGHERFDDPSGAASIFSDIRDPDDVELVTDMVDDMTKDDDIEDEFVEALNPNLSIPRLNPQSERQPAGWFSVCLN